MTISEEPPITRERPRRTGTTRPRRTGTRKFTVPNAVTPGWTHELLAALTLRALQEKGADPGRIDDEFVKLIPGAEDSPEPAVLLARVYAHLAWRIPGIRQLAKRFEGREARAGLGSDLLALGAQLYLRNRDLVREFGVQQAKRAAQSKTSPTPGADHNAGASRMEGT